MTDVESPECHLASSECYSLEQPRKCWRIKRISGDHRDDYLLIRMDLPIWGDDFDVGPREIDTAIVVPRHAGVSLFSIREWPVFVHLAYPLVEDPQSPQILHTDELKLMAWAELYETEEAAAAKRM